jgi:carbamoyltransferase
MTIIAAVARGHNGSTTLLKDGEVIFYLEEERLSRSKYDGSPLLGLQKVFEYVDHIDHLVICHTHRNGPTLDWSGEDLYQGYVRKLSKGKFEFETHFIDTVHHQLHAACGFYNSGFESAACVIADGAGSFLKVDEVEDICYEFETIFKTSYPSNFETVYKHIGTKQSIGLNEPEENMYLTEYPGLTKMYEAVTQYCGFPAIEAGKLMGLAPYGNPNKDIPKFFRDGWGNRDLIIPTYPNAAQLNVSRYKILLDDAKAHDPENPGQYTDIQKDLAYAVQDETSNRMVELIRKAHELTGEKNIVVCGGYGLNCVANYKYWKEFPDLNIYCEPISHDGGTSIGAAKMIYYTLNKNCTANKQESIYYGPQYDPDTYIDYLEGLDVTNTSYDEVAKLIRDGNIVTIFQGRSEGGPRALGNRSILFDPTIKDGKDIVNNVKHREFFRPFACSILKEKVNDWFDLAEREESPHMMYAVDCLPGVKEKIPSVIHVDGTCRIQTVTEEQNEHYYNLISAFEKLSEVPILFNTSFNLGGDPLVETIEDAINTLNNSKIEYMYLPEIQKLVKILN